MAARDYDIVAIGGDLDDPQSFLSFTFSYVRRRLKFGSNVVRDRIIEFSSGASKANVLIVLGNHDSPDSRGLHGRSVDVAGLIVGGVGGSLPARGLLSFPFELEEKEYESILKQLGHVDVLVSHEPPYDTKCDIAYGGEHVGSRAIREYVLREQPRLVLTGHIHESPAIDRLGNTTVLNPGAFVNGNYGAVEILPDDVRATIKQVGTRRKNLTFEHKLEGS